MHRPSAPSIALLLAALVATIRPVAAGEPPRGYSIPLIDLAGETARQVVVDREPGQYLGHPTTVLLEDGRTMLCVYPKGHGRGAIVMKRSDDGGLTWSGRLPVPASWATSREVPTIHRVVDAAGTKRLILWSGLFPARLAVSADDGAAWSELVPAGEWGGIVVMSSVGALRTGPGHYVALFHDDGRFLSAGARQTTPVTFTLLATRSTDGGLTWSAPETIQSASDVHLCEPGLVRSPDGRQLAILLRENSRRRNSFLMTSDDEAASWSAPRELPGALTGDRHVAVTLPDGRLFISFRDTTHDSPTKGDWVAWLGRYEDIVGGREGRCRIRLMDNHKGGDCGYPGVELLPDGTIVTTTYGHWEPGAEPFIVSVRLHPDEIDARLREAAAEPARLPRDRLLESPDPADDTAADRWRSRRRSIVAGMERVMGRLPGDEKRVPLDVEVVEEVDRGGHVRRLVHYTSEPGCRTPAYLCIPKSLLAGNAPPAPAVLCLHPTNDVIGPGTIVGLLPDDAGYAAELAERGFVTIAPAYPRLADYQPDLFALGWESGTLKAVWDNIRALDLLDELPFVRHGRYAAIGHSLGGHNAVFTGVFDERIAAVVSSCGLDSFLDYYDGDPATWRPERGWCQTRYMPRLAEYRGRLEAIPFDFHELLAALAPRHVLVVAPTGDDNFRAASVDRVAAAAAEVFALESAADRLRVIHPESGHAFTPDARREAYAVIDAVLAPDAAPSRGE